MSLPTIEQVREHEERGGIWLLHFAEDQWLPSYRRLSASYRPGEITGLWIDDWTAIEFVPCDQQGNPLPLVNALAETRRLLDVAEAGWHREMSQAIELRARAEKAEQEMWRLRGENAVHVADIEGLSQWRDALVSKLAATEQRCNELSDQLSALRLRLGMAR